MRRLAKGQLVGLIVALLIVTIFVLWLVAPQAIFGLAGIWRMLGEPDWTARLIAALAFAAIVLFLSVRLLKSGPI